MGFIEFVKSAGARVFGTSDSEPSSDNSDAGSENTEATAAVALKEQVESLGLEVENLEIEFQGDVAKVSGKVPTQAEREKVILAVGNVRGVAKVDDRLQVARPQPQAQYYTVQPGDSLSKIAKQYYGNALKYPAIFEANRPLLQNPDRIYPGQVLRIPPLT